MQSTAGPVPASSIHRRMAGEYMRTRQMRQPPHETVIGGLHACRKPQQIRASSGTCLVLTSLVTVVILIVVLAFVGYRMTTPEDRERHLLVAKALLQRGRDMAMRGQPEGDAFRAALRGRLPRASVTLAFAALMALFTLIADPSRLGTTALHTTNGQWWRLVTAIFVQGGFLALLLNAAVLTQVGFIAERLVGNIAFATTFLAAGIIANIVDTGARPIEVGNGASGAILGVYGLLVACVIWSRLRPSSITMPLPTMKTVGLIGTIYLFISLINGRLSSGAEWTGFFVGLCCGAVLAYGVGEEHTPPKRVGAVAAASFVLALIMAFPLRGLMDVRPEIQKVVALEEQPSTVYEGASEKFRKGKMSAEMLADLIELAIVPKLQAADERLKTYKKVPAEHRPMLVEAEEYLQLRCKSWKLRADAIRKSNTLVKRDQSKSDQNWRLSAEARHHANLVALGNAEGAERTSLEAYKKVKTTAGSDLRPVRQ